MTRATQALIDLDALRHNFARVRSYAPHSKIMPVIKANAYGHGMAQVAAALTQADAFAVATIDEAVLLREFGVSIPITVLQGVRCQDELSLAQELRLDLVVCQLEQVALLEYAKTDKPLVIWLKLDTGMHRLGLSPQQFAEAYRRLGACSAVAEVRFMSHFACADDTNNPMTDEQLRNFDHLTRRLNGAGSLANSAAIMAYSQSHREWVRPGIMLYGATPLLGWRERDDGLKPVMTLRSTVIALKSLQPGEAVGYGADWRAQRPTRLALAAIGYGDGYPRKLPSGTPVLVNKRICSLVGRVSMDSIALDVTDFADTQLGDVVTLWGEGLPVGEIAEHADTIPYELLCQITPRVPRCFMEK